MGVVTKMDVLILLHQTHDLSNQMLDWLEMLSDEEFQAMWEGRACVPFEQFVKLEVFEEAARTVASQLKKKLRSCDVN